MADHQRSMIRMLAEWFHIDKETVCKIITEDLGGKKLCARFVPHMLMLEQWEDCLTSCHDFLQMHENDPEFFNKIVIGDDLVFCLRPGKHTPVCDLSRPSVTQGKLALKSHTSKPCQRLFLIF